MPREARRKRRRNNNMLKPGSNAQAAKEFGGRGDFGAPAGGERTADRDYVSRNTKLSDPGAAQPWSHDFDGVRISGVGGHTSGDGSSSGGDLDTDIVGVGTGGGVAASGDIPRPPEPDDSDAASREFASGGPARDDNQTHVGQIGGRKQVDGTVHRPPDAAQDEFGQGAGAITNPHVRDDDSFAGEVSFDEARGQDRQTGHPPA